MDTHTITILSQYDKSMEILNISKSNILGILDLSEFVNLKELDCSSNEIKCIKNTPETMVKLICSANKIEHLDNLSSQLIELECDVNQIKSLDNLPNTLVELNCNSNPINVKN